jgi:hypothetical protein
MRVCVTHRESGFAKLSFTNHNSLQPMPPAQVRSL